jgi:CheY-like chemotaxis protein
MGLDLNHFNEDFDPRFKTFHELMARKVRDVLLVSSLYDACIIEEDCRLAERIINEYRGLNLSQPPRLTWVSSAEEALEALKGKHFDLLITMPRLIDMDALALGSEVKKRCPELPVILLTHKAMAERSSLDESSLKGLDRIYVWTGNTDLLLAQIKNVEDRWNVRRDTEIAGVRVIILVEDSPIYLSSILPILYRELVSQTQAVLEEGLNEEHRLLTMRARAKILVAQNYEEALELYQTFKPYLLGVISDTRFPRAGKLDHNAGVDFLSKIKSDIPDMPMLLTSSEPSNRQRAELIPARFADKNSPTLHREIRSFILERLGFGDFVFHLPDGTEVARVSTWRALEEALLTVPDESFYYHWSNNDFSRWLFARTEITLASRLRPVTADDFSGNVKGMREFLIASLRARRLRRQKGVVVDFDPHDFDPEMDFLKIGKGSLGGKARGLVFISTLLRRTPALFEKYPNLEILVPPTLIITTEAFDAFIQAGDLKELSKTDLPDHEVAGQFLKTALPDWITDSLRAYLQSVHYPLAVRSSGLLEDAQYWAYAGLYQTYMIPNDHFDFDLRLQQLVTAVKLVYASTYFQGPKAFARRVGQRTEEEKMAVIVQRLIGGKHNQFFYPAVSGVAQSHNYYPIYNMKPQDGLATVALGLGKTVAEGGQALRFSPRHPQLLPQFASVEDTLKNAQRSFYALKIDGRAATLEVDDRKGLALRDINTALEEAPVKILASTFVEADHRFSDNPLAQGPKVVTFNNVLKYKSFPLAELLVDILELLHEGMGCPLELEFSVHLCPPGDCRQTFALLQVRPMSARVDSMEVDLAPEDIDRAFVYSTAALGNALRNDMTDILYVKPESFDPARTVEISREISQFNKELSQAGRPYLLIGPGRWGSADRWLGIPVVWADISGVGAMVETTAANLKAEPSQGSHFFHNVTSLGINYLTVTGHGAEFIKWDWLAAQPVIKETGYLAHLRLDRPFSLKVDGRRSHGVISA